MHHVFSLLCNLKKTTMRQIKSVLERNVISYNIAILGLGHLFKSQYRVFIQQRISLRDHLHLKIKPVTKDIFCVVHKPINLIETLWTLQERNRFSNKSRSLVYKALKRTQMTVKNCTLMPLVRGPFM